MESYGKKNYWLNVFLIVSLISCQLAPGYVSAQEAAAPAEQNEVSESPAEDPAETAPEEQTSDESVSETGPIEENPSEVDPADTENDPAPASAPENSGDDSAPDPSEPSPDSIPDSQDNQNISSSENGQEPAAEISNTNEIVATNEIGIESNTGQNNASGNSASTSDPSAPENSENESASDEVCEDEKAAEITTGDAQAQASAVNVANTNITGENWMDLIINIDDLSQGDIDLLSRFALILLQKQLSNDPEIANLDIKNMNLADIKNYVEAAAATGENNASQNQGDVSIETGEAIAQADIVNLINRNLVGENWLFATINIFGELDGDIIVPGEGLLDAPNSSSQENTNIEISNNNDSAITNSATTAADSGNNAALANEGAVQIETGAAQGETNVANVTNLNIFKNNWFKLILNLMGDWTGQIIGWDGDDQDLAYELESSGAEGASLLSRIRSITNSNSAKIDNIAVASASTGNNVASENSGDVLVKTGDAAARANIFNFANANIIGNNWLFAIINVMGTWRGNLIFAYPDLEVSINDGLEKVHLNDEITYQVRLKNNGYAAGKNVDLHLSLSEGMEKVDDLDFNFPEIKSGETKILTIRAHILEKTDLDKVVGTVQAKTQSQEKNLSNNEASDQDQIGDNSLTDDYDSKIKIRRSVLSQGQAAPGGLLRHEIQIVNTGDNSLRDVVATDRLENSRGEKIATLSWKIGSVDKDEKIIITYDILINQGIVADTYRYEARAEGKDPEGEKVRSNLAFNKIQIASSAPGRNNLAGTENDQPEEKAEIANVLLSNAASNSQKMSTMALALSGLAGILLLGGLIFDYLRRKKPDLIMNAKRKVNQSLKLIFLFFSKKYSKK